MKKPALDSRCVALDSAGRRCRSTQTRVDSYHGDGEIYSDYMTKLSEDMSPSWVSGGFANFIMLIGKR